MSYEISDDALAYAPLPTQLARWTRTPGLPAFYAAMLATAIRDAQGIAVVSGDGDSLRRHRAAAQADAIAWLHVDEASSDEHLSARDICEALGVSLRAIRARFHEYPGTMRVIAGRRSYREGRQERRA